MWRWSKGLVLDGMCFGRTDVFARLADCEFRGFEVWSVLFVFSGLRVQGVQVLKNLVCVRVRLELLQLVPIAARHTYQVQ